MLYTIIYDYLGTLFGSNLEQYSTTIMGVSTTLKSWLQHTGLR